MAEVATLLHKIVRLELENRLPVELRTGTEVFTWIDGGHFHAHAKVKLAGSDDYSVLQARFQLTADPADLSNGVEARELARAMAARLKNCGF